MALIRLNIDSFKRDLGGIANRLANQVVNRVEQRLENAVEDTFAKGLKKIGLSDGVSRDIASRFTNSISVGRADDFFRSSTAEQNRVSKFEIEERLLAGESETAFDAVQRIKKTDIASASVMQFPDQLGEYYMKLDFQSYHRPSPQMQAVFKRFQTIALPVPRDLKETFDLDVNSSKQGGAGGLADIGTDIFRGAGSSALDGKFALVYSAVAQALEGTTAEILGQTLGAVPNPHLQAIFSGVELRSHTFQWTFAPRNPQESIRLKNIIREIKKNSLPSYSTTGTAALQYPPMVEVMFVPSQLNELIKFKKCLVKSVSVNYAPAGLPSFFKGTDGKRGEPTMIQFEIQLLETEIQTARDYGLESGDREDGIENFKDLVSKGIASIDTASGLGIGDAIQRVNSSLNEAVNTVSSTGAQASTNRER
jgi:hypothetical protein